MNSQLVLQIALQAIGGLGIFLLGMKNMSEGMQAVAGARLRKLITAVTRNRFLAVAIGALVTSVIQSSSVTTVMVVGLVNSGFMSLMQAIGVIFGANIGTTITGWILTLRIGKYGLPLLGIAALIFLFSKRERTRYTAMVFMGIGMVFFGLELMSSGFKPLRTIPEFEQWFSAFQAVSYFGVLKCALIGCLLTMIVQSSSATLGITMGLASTGIISFNTAAALVLGENIGTTITALLASLGAGTNAKRTAYAHMTFNVIGVLWITALFFPYMKLIHAIMPVDPGLAVIKDGVETFPHTFAAIAAVHTGFNVANTLLFIPLMPLLARFVTRLIPDKEGKEQPHLTYLDVRMLDTPALGLEQSRKEIIFMDRAVRKMMTWLRSVVTEDDKNQNLEKKIFRREDILDNVQKEVSVFLGQLIAGRVTHEVTIEAYQQFRMADEYESVSDYIKTVLKLHKKLKDNKLTFTRKGQDDLLSLHDQVAAFLAETGAYLEQPETIDLSRIYNSGNEITITMKDARAEHLERLTKEHVTPLASLVFADILNAYRRIKDHIVNIAEAAAGEK